MKKQHGTSWVTDERFATQLDAEVAAVVLHKQFDRRVRVIHGDTGRTLFRMPGRKSVIKGA